MMSNEKPNPIFLYAWQIYVKQEKTSQFYLYPSTKLKTNVKCKTSIFFYWQINLPIQT